MKCIRCGKDCTYPERSDHKCPHCKGAFALEPRTGDALNDVMLDAAIKAVSADGKVRWNLDNLYYEVCRRKYSKTKGCGCGIACLMGTEVIFSKSLVEHGILITAMGLLIGGAAYAVSRESTLFDRNSFNQCWTKWANTHGIPASLIVPQPVKQKAAQLESDVGDYSFDRAVICDQARTVDLLLANNFHFENNCAILTLDGYPSHAFKTVKAMLQRNPRLRVWVLHDCTPAGCQVAYTLKNDPDWFPQGVQIIDVGLRPQHAPPLKKLWEPSTPPVKGGPGLTSSELSWLGKYQLALAAIRPEQVIKRLFRSMSSVPEGTDGIYIDSLSFSSDAGTSDGGGDSFG